MIVGAVLWVKKKISYYSPLERVNTPLWLRNVAPQPILVKQCTLHNKITDNKIQITKNHMDDGNQVGKIIKNNQK